MHMIRLIRNCSNFSSVLWINWKIEDWLDKMTNSIVAVTEFVDYCYNLEKIRNDLKKITILV